MVDTLARDYRRALTEWEQAQRNFENADTDFVDVAIAQLSAAEAKVQTLLRELKKEVAV